jgi:hypothetical protein
MQRLCDVPNTKSLGKKGSFSAWPREVAEHTDRREMDSSAKRESDFLINPSVWVSSFGEEQLEENTGKIDDGAERRQHQL